MRIIEICFDDVLSAKFQTYKSIYLLLDRIVMGYLFLDLAKLRNPIKWQPIRSWFASKQILILSKEKNP